ncbi:MAG: hypothetical protein ACYS7Y_12040 [Planctomycetota bacterium]
MNSTIPIALIMAMYFTLMTAMGCYTIGHNMYGHIATAVTGAICVTFFLIKHWTQR